MQYVFCAKPSEHKIPRIYCFMMISNVIIVFGIISTNTEPVFAIKKL